VTWSSAGGLTLTDHISLLISTLPYFFVSFLPQFSLQLNPEYLPRLRDALSSPQSVGIVGGRPGSSFFLAGCQGTNAIYLDPHEVQPAAGNDGDWLSFRADALRTLPLESLDPSMALGFVCRDAKELEDLCVQLERVEMAAGSAPLLTVARGEEPPPPPEDWASEEETSSSGGDATAEGDDIAGGGTEEGSGRVPSARQSSTATVTGVQAPAGPPEVAASEKTDQKEGGESLQATAGGGIETYGTTGMRISLQGTAEGSPPWDPGDSLSPQNSARLGSQSWEVV
jgi:hypothetical protein